MKSIFPDNADGSDCGQVLNDLLLSPVRQILKRLLRRNSEEDCDNKAANRESRHLMTRKQIFPISEAAG